MTCFGPAMARARRRPPKSPRRPNVRAARAGRRRLDSSASVESAPFASGARRTVIATMEMRRLMAPCTPLVSKANRFTAREFQQPIEIDSTRRAYGRVGPNQPQHVRELVAPDRQARSGAAHGDFRGNLSR